MSNEIANIPKPPCQTLADVVDEYLINRGINKKKYFVMYLVIAKRAWQKLFWNTIWIVKNEWRTLQAGTPFNYIEVPHDCTRLFSVNEVGRDNKIIPLFYAEDLNILPLPTSQKCGCQKCDCEGNLDELTGLTYTTTLLFTINGIDYFEQSWKKLCSNGDVLLYRQVPTKKYNDFRGNKGDFSNDYNQDFSTGNPSSDNFEIVTETFQTKLCSLAVRDCGCPEPTPENEELFNCFCGSFPGGFRGWFHRRHHRENTLFENINNNGRGEVKISEDGRKIYYNPPKHHHHRPMPKFLLVNYQTSGLATEIDGSVSVPDFALDAMFTSIDWRSKRFNNKYSEAQKKEAKYEYNDAVNEVISFLNPLSLDWLQNVQDKSVKW